jgi:hypothetical protein
MRTLDEMTRAVRRDEIVTDWELRYAVVAYDVMLAGMELEKDPVRLQKYMVAGDSCPKEFAGPANDPQNPESVAWHRAFIK